MRALILAAGEGKRLQPLTNDRPKPMILLNGRPLLEYVIDELPDEVRELIIVVGYKGDKVREHFKDEYKGRPVSYVEQKEQLGTGHAVLMARELLRERFMLVNSDDIGDKESFTEGIKHEYALFVATHTNPERFGVVETNSDGTLKSIVEKPEMPSTNLVSTGTMMLSPEIFDIPLIRHPNGEHYVVDMLSGIMKKHPIQVIRQKTWITVTFPDDIQRTEELLKSMGR